MNAVRTLLGLMTFAALLQLTGCSKPSDSAEAGKPTTKTEQGPVHPMLTQLDTNKDGKLSFEEWAASSRSQFRSQLHGESKEITVDSLVALLTDKRTKAQEVLARKLPDKAPEGAKRRHEQLVDRYQVDAARSDAAIKASAIKLVDFRDANRDGKVTEDEWLAFPKAEYILMDTNQDKSVSSAELTAFLKNQQPLQTNKP